MPPHRRLNKLPTVSGPSFYGCIRNIRDVLILLEAIRTHVIPLTRSDCLRGRVPESGSICVFDTAWKMLRCVDILRYGPSKVGSIEDIQVMYYRTRANPELDSPDPETFETPEQEAELTQGLAKGSVRQMRGIPGGVILGEIMKQTLNLLLGGVLRVVCHYRPMDVVNGLIIPLSENAALLAEVVKRSPKFRLPTTTSPKPACNLSSHIPLEFLAKMELSRQARASQPSRRAKKSSKKSTKQKASPYPPVQHDQQLIAYNNDMGILQPTPLAARPGAGLEGLLKSMRLQDKLPSPVAHLRAVPPLPEHMLYASSQERNEVGFWASWLGDLGSTNVGIRPTEDSSWTHLPLPLPLPLPHPLPLPYSHPWPQVINPAPEFTAIRCEPSPPSPPNCDLDDDMFDWINYDQCDTTDSWVFVEDTQSSSRRGPFDGRA